MPHKQKSNLTIDSSNARALKIARSEESSINETPEYMLMCTLYILAGLGLTSTIIELVRQQYARSWRQLQALAEMLGRLADDADRQAAAGNKVGDLLRSELRRAAEALSPPTKGGSRGDWQQAVEQLVQDINRPRAPPPIIQIVVYESSV